MLNNYIGRKENGKIFIKALDIEIFISELFEICNDESEAEWVKDTLVDIVEGMYEEKIEELE